MSKPECSSSSYLCKGIKGYACIPKSNQCSSLLDEKIVETINKLSETIKEQRTDQAVTPEEASEGLKKAASMGQIAALGGVAAEIGMINEINKEIGKETDQNIQEELTKIREKLGDEETEYRINQSKSMVKQSLLWAKENGYNGDISEVFWTARPGAMKDAGFPDVPQQKHPADLVVKFSDGKSLGISAKSSKTDNAKLPFKNRGINSLERELGFDLDDEQKKRESNFLSKVGVRSKSELKKKMRSNKRINKQAQIEGRRILKQVQNKIVEQFSKTDPVADALENMFLDTNDFGLPYIKVTGLATKRAKVDDPLNNSTITKLKKAKSVDFQATGGSNVRVLADGKVVMNIRPVYMNEKLATGIKVVAS